MAFDSAMSTVAIGDEFLHPLSGIPPQFGNDVRVGVHSESDLRMTEDIHHNSRRDTLNQQQRCARVSEVVKAPLGQPSNIQHAMEVMTHNRSVNGTPAVCCKHKIPAARFRANESALIRLSESVISQRPDY